MPSLKLLQPFFEFASRSPQDYNSTLRTRSWRANSSGRGGAHYTIRANESCRPEAWAGECLGYKCHSGSLNTEARDGQALLEECRLLTGAKGERNQMSPETDHVELADDVGPPPTAIRCSKGEIFPSLL